MGSGRDKRKKCKEKKDGPTVGTGALKTEKKTAKNEEKKEKRADKRLEGDEDNLEAMLQRFAIEDKSRKEVVIENDCPPPSARKVNEILMFGGEYSDLDSGKISMFNDLYRYNCDRQRWTKVISPNRPAPRCAHQGVVHKGQMYIFATWEWDNLPSKAGPSARSGHRVALHKGRMFLFGGFFDNGKEVRYNNELWVLNIEDLKWHQVGPVPGQHTNSGAIGGSKPWPTARGGFQMVVNADTMFLYGGYSKATARYRRAAHGGCHMVVYGDHMFMNGGDGKSTDDSDKDIEHGHIHDDVWALDLKAMTWERVKKAGMAPRARASFALVSHKARALLFGGVSDNESRGGEDMSSEFHNDMYQFSFDKRRWFAAEMRPVKKTAAETADTEMVEAKDATAPGASKGGSAGGPGGKETKVLDPSASALMKAGNDKNSAIYRAAARIQAHFRGFVVRKAYKVYQMGGPISEILYSPALYGLDLSARNAPRPKGRIGAMACVVGNNLWLFGGIIEVGEKEITLDDMWSLDLAKMDG
eukprot:gene18504-25003_t